MWYTDVKKGFGLTIKKWRGRSGISQEELAKRAGLHRSYVADIERGARNASLQSIEKLAKALELSLSTLFEPLDDSPARGGVGASVAESNSLVDILLVEDDRRDVELTLAAFRQARLANRVQVARDGAEALDYVFGRASHPGGKTARRPQIILLDLGLPKVHGLEVLRATKADSRTRKTRVVVLTVSRKDEHIATALRLGADAYLVKPIDFHQFTEITPKLQFAWSLQEHSSGNPRTAGRTQNELSSR
jgi:CheY-like chemotaxis protein/DNA-binding XRE family transcriptional regulator